MQKEYNILKLTTFIIFLTICYLLTASIQSQAAENLIDKAQACEKSGDHLCAYQALAKHAENNPDTALLHRTFGTPNKLGESIELQFMLASPKMSESTIKNEADRMISLISSRSKHTQTHSYILPYYVLKAEVCKQLNDKPCVIESIHPICTAFANNEFSWPKAPKLNTPLQGYDRAKKASDDCQYNLYETDRVKTLYTMIDNAILAIESEQDIDTYATLFASPDEIQTFKDKGHWASFRKLFQTETPKTLAQLKKAKNMQPLIERFGQEYKAKFTFKDPNSPGIIDGLILTTVDGTWKL